MLQVGYIRENSELVKGKLAVKNFKEVNLVDEIILLDEEIRQQKKKNRRCSNADKFKICPGPTTK
jgi:seryl-tRNA synthetase